METRKVFKKEDTKVEFIIDTSFHSKGDVIICHALVAEKLIKSGKCKKLSK